MRKSKPHNISEIARSIKVVPYIKESNMWDLPYFREKMRIAEETIRTIGLPKRPKS